MTIDCRIADGIGTVTVASRDAADRARLEEFLRAPELKGVVVRLAGNPAGDATALSQTIAASPVPTAAAIRGDCAGADLEIARACDFRYASAPDSDAERQATEFLRALTAGRSAALVRTVMTSIRNAARMPLGEALAEETSLFCQAARRLIAAGEGEPR